MKITADMQPQFQGRSAGSRTASLPPGGVTAVRQQVPKINNSQARAILQNTPTEQNLSSALVIMNKARLIIQQALSVSTQLRSEATVTMNSGSINQTEINTQLASINSSLTEFNVGVTVPEMTEYVAPEAVKTLNDNIGQLQTAASSPYSSVNIAAVENNLKKADRQFENSAVQITGRLQQYAAAYNSVKPDVTALSQSIRSNYNTALETQGNIIPSNLNQLLG